MSILRKTLGGLLVFGSASLVCLPAQAGFIGDLLGAVTQPGAIVSNPADSPEVQNEVDYLGQGSQAEVDYLGQGSNAETDYLNSGAQSEIDYYNSFNR